MTTWIILAIGLAMGSTDAATNAPLVPGSTPLEESGRYQSSRSYEETLDFYKRLFRQTGGVRWRNIVNQPTIKAKHIESLRKSTKWQGLNIYEKQGDVRIFVISRDQKEATK